MIILRDDPYEHVVAYPASAPSDAKRWIEGKARNDVQKASLANVYLHREIHIYPWNDGWEILTFAPLAQWRA